MVLGIDEVGRGAWAGPLVVGAVVLGGISIDGLADSKLLSKTKREMLYDQVTRKSRGYGLGWVSAGEIDNIGLAEALRLATKRAVEQVQESGVSFHEIIIDGTSNFLSDTPLADYVIVLPKADMLVPSVSAASILAKVARDRYMYGQAEIYAQYGFDSHVGYGTFQHRTAIDEYGVTDLHRLSIAPLRKYADRIGVDKEAGLASRFMGRLVRSTTGGAEVLTTRQIGDRSELAAVNYLEGRGFEVCARNWKTKLCEVDIIAKKSGAYYFIEVKHRRTDVSGSGFDAITPVKLTQMKKAVRVYTAINHLTETDVRIGVIATFGGEYIVSGFELVDI